MTLRPGIWKNSFFILLKIRNLSEFFEMIVGHWALSNRIGHVNNKKDRRTFFSTNLQGVVHWMVRDGSRAAAISKMEYFVIIVNGWRPLTIITKYSILDVAAALDPSLMIISLTRVMFSLPKSKIELGKVASKIAWMKTIFLSSFVFHL